MSERSVSHLFALGLGAAFALTASYFLYEEHGKRVEKGKHDEKLKKEVLRTLNRKIVEVMRAKKKNRIANSNHIEEINNMKTLF